mgnify:CR=1 FL=1
MNGKKAKLLRSLASVKSSDEQLYIAVEHTLRNKQIKNALGEVTHNYRTGTLKLKEGSRILYKMLKKNYLSSLRAA